MEIVKMAFRISRSDDCQKPKPTKGSEGGRADSSGSHGWGMSMLPLWGWEEDAGAAPVGLGGGRWGWEDTVGEIQPEQDVFA